MIDDHWFDALNKRWTQRAPRRDILSAVTALIIIRHLGASDVAGKGGGKGGKHKGNGKGGGGNNGNNGNGKGNGNKKPKPPKPRDICGKTWPGKHQQDDRDHCRRIRKQCPPGSDRAFCIVDNFPGHEGDLVADCCDPTEECCGSECAHLPTSKFHCGKCNFPCPNGSDCLHGSCQSLCGPDGVACPEDLSVCCREGNTCCPGFGCVNTDAHPRNCGSCGKPCGVGQSCIGGECKSDDPPGWEWCETDSGWFGVYTTGPFAANRLHCGGCGLECPGGFLQGQWCFEGSCGCGDDRRWCGEEYGCVPDSLPC